MPENDYANAPMMLTVYNVGFEEVNYTIPINAVFDIQTPLQALELEARAKSCAVMIQVALIPLDELYGDQPDETEGDSENVEPE